MAESNLIGNEIPSANPARLPALGAPELSVEFLAALKEICEVLLGRRGSTWDRAVTFRDLQAGGLGGFIPGMVGSAAIFNPATGQITTDGGASFDIDAAIRESAAYKDLLTKIGSAEELENLPQQVAAQLREAITQLARERKADIRSLEGKLQNEQQSLAWRLTEITASLNEAAAGAREYNAAYADSLRAVAIRVETVAAALDTAGGGVIAQELLEATADAVEGLKGQYSLKIQTNPTAGQPPVIAGIALSVEDPIAGPGTSSLVFLADKVGFYTSGGTLNPFSISGNQVMVTNLIAKSLRVIMADGTTVLDAGKTLAEQTASNPNLVPFPTGWPTFSGGGYANRNSNSVFSNGEFIGLGGLATAGTYVAAESPPCGIPAGAPVTVSFDASCDSGTRLLSLNFYGPNVDTAQFQTTLTTTFKRYVWTITLPNHADVPKAILRMWSTAAGAQIIISNIKVEQGYSATPLGDNIITAANAKNRVFIPYLSALSAFFGSAQLGIGGALWAGQPDYDTGTGLRLGTDGSGNPYLSMRSANGKYVRIRPSTDTFEMNAVRLTNPDLVLATRSGSISSNPGTSFTHSRNVSGGYCGTHTASINNAVNPAYSWSISSPYPQATFYLVGQSQAACSIYVTGKGAVSGDEVSATATCVMTDGGVSVVRTVDVFVSLT